MLPDWINKRYEILWQSFQSSSFRFEEAAAELSKKIKDAKDEVNVVLSELRKEGMLKVEFDPNDARKRIYKLKSKKEMISDK